MVQIDEGKIQAHLGEVVRSTVEETLNALLDAEADRLCRTERYAILSRIHFESPIIIKYSDSTDGSCGGSSNTT